MTRLLPCLLLLASACLPAFAQGQFKLLVVAIPNRYHADFAVVAKPQFERMAQAHDFEMTWAWNASPFDGDLSQYAAIVLLSTSGEDLARGQRGKLEAYVRAGGGIVAVHRALVFNPPGDWPWYEKMIGRAFVTHPMVQTATLRVADAGFPATFGLPARWAWTDEWYAFGPPLVAGLHDVLEVDESSYDPTRTWPGQVAHGMGEHHPVAWYHAYAGGRVFASALGHTPALWDDRRFLEHLYGGIWWAATGKGLAPAGPRALRPSPAPASSPAGVPAASARHAGTRTAPRR